MFSKPAISDRILLADQEVAVRDSRLIPPKNVRPENRQDRQIKDAAQRVGQLEARHGLQSTAAIEISAIAAADI